MRDLGFIVAAGCTRTEAEDLAGFVAGEEGGGRIRWSSTGSGEDEAREAICRTAGTRPACSGGGAWWRGSREEELTGRGIVGGRWRPGEVDGLREARGRRGRARDLLEELLSSGQRAGQRGTLGARQRPFGPGRAGSGHGGPARWREAAVTGGGRGLEESGGGAEVARSDWLE